MPVELHPLSLGIMPTMDVFPFIVAQKSGIYDSLGLKVNLVQFDSPYDRDAAFLTGKIDGTITDYPSIALLQVHHPGGSVIMATQGYFCFITNRQNPINQFDELKEKKEGIIYKLEHDKIQLNKYVIVLAENANNNLEFYDTALLLQRGWKKRRLLVVGIADGFEEALYLVEKIAQEVYDVTGDMKIRKYLLEQQKKFEEGKV